MTRRTGRKKAVLTLLGSYFLAAVTGALGLINWFLLRDATFVFLTNSTINPWSWQAIDYFSFILYGILWLVLVLFSQYDYKKGIEQKRLRRKFCLLTSVQLFLLVFTQIYILYASLGYIDLLGAALVFSQSLLAIALFCIAFWNREHIPRRKRHNHSLKGRE